MPTRTLSLLPSYILELAHSNWKSIPLPNKHLNSAKNEKLAIYLANFCLLPPSLLQNEPPPRLIPFKQPTAALNTSIWPSKSSQRIACKWLDQVQKILGRTRIMSTPFTDVFLGLFKTLQQNISSKTIVLLYICSSCCKNWAGAI